MSYELIYTSVPSGLTSGTRGFCVVAATPGMPPRLQRLLESLSGYRHLYSPGDPRNPAVHSLVTLQCNGVEYSILSQIVDAGIDYSKRSNKLAHHVAVPASERAMCSAAGPFQNAGFFRSQWRGKPGPLSPRPLPNATTPNTHPPAPTWQSLAGDAGWAGVLAATATMPDREYRYIIYPASANPLRLALESLRLLDHKSQWQATFSTSYSTLPPTVRCRWRFVMAGSEEAKAARQKSPEQTIDLTRKLGRPTPGRLTDIARGYPSHGDTPSVQKNRLSMAGDRPALDIPPTPVRQTAGKPSSTKMPPPAPVITPGDTRSIPPNVPVGPITKRTGEWTDARTARPARKRRYAWMISAAAVLLALLAGVGVGIPIGIRMEKRNRLLSQGPHRQPAAAIDVGMPEPREHSKKADEQEQEPQSKKTKRKPQPGSSENGDEAAANQERGESGSIRNDSKGDSENGGDHAADITSPEIDRRNPQGNNGTPRPSPVAVTPDDAPGGDSSPSQANSSDSKRNGRQKIGSPNRTFEYRNDFFQQTLDSPTSITIEWKLTPTNVTIYSRNTKLKVEDAENKWHIVVNKSEKELAHVESAGSQLTIALDKNNQTEKSKLKGAVLVARSDNPPATLSIAFFKAEEQRQFSLSQLMVENENIRVFKPGFDVTNIEFATFPKDGQKHTQEIQPERRLELSIPHYTFVIEAKNHTNEKNKWKIILSETTTNFRLTDFCDKFSSTENWNKKKKELDSIVGKLRTAVNGWMPMREPSKFRAVRDAANQLDEFVSNDGYLHVKFLAPDGWKQKWKTSIKQLNGERRGNTQKKKSPELAGKLVDFAEEIQDQWTKIDKVQKELKKADSPEIGVFGTLEDDSVIPLWDPRQN